MGKRLVCATMTLGTPALVGALCVRPAGDVGAAFSAVPAWVLAAAVAVAAGLMLGASSIVAVVVYALAVAAATRIPVAMRERYGAA